MAPKDRNGTTDDAQNHGKTPAAAPEEAKHATAEQENPQSVPKRAKDRGPLSPITRRILAVNLAAVGLLVLGLLWVGEYRKGLTDSEIASLTTQAEMIAAALGEVAVDVDRDSGQALMSNEAKQVVRRLVTLTRTRALLFVVDGRLVADSQTLQGPGGTVIVEAIPPPEPEEGGFFKALFAHFDDFANWVDRMWFETTTKLEPLPGTTPAKFAEAPETREALAGRRGSAVRLNEDGSMMLAVAVPVQRYKKVLGAIHLSKDSREIDQAVLDIRLNILQIVGFTLVITVLLSIYLAGTIARPLYRLADAAERIRGGMSRAYELPRFTGRKDEIGELADTLRDMTEALWDRMDAIEQFAADVAHEIKNPLASLRSAVETVDQVKDPERRKKLLAVIQQDVERLDRLISDISDASRLDAQLSREHFEKINLTDMLKALVDLHNAKEPDEEETERRREAIAVHFATGEKKDLFINGMSDRLVRIFENIITNAKSFSPKDGRINITLSKEDQRAIIHIDDEGPGIPEGKEKDIFNRFYSERPAGEKFGTHSGLGLSISKQIVEAHGGSISAHTLKDRQGKARGARFTIRLPLTRS